MTNQRKVLLFFICLIVLTIALLTNKITGSEFTNGIAILYGLFITGNGVEHISKSK